ncbi:MAG TPA: hypothetical protein VNN08_00490 [Thermoanaerobaculia bacterium]|nr:hypothetical protein [Thermoanaerobaculia bacterium]
MDLDAITKDTKSRYGFDSWNRAGVSRGTEKFLLRTDELPGFELVSREPGVLPGHAYIDCLRATTTGTSIVVEVTELPSMEAAQESLIRFLMTSMVRRLPDCAARGMTLGDASFCSTEEPPLDLIFTRGNVLIRAFALTSDARGLADVARAVDEQIVRAAVDR